METVVCRDTNPTSGYLGLQSTVVIVVVDGLEKKNQFLHRQRPTMNGGGGHDRIICCRVTKEREREREITHCFAIQVVCVLSKDNFVDPFDV
jgi:hypothetical protein